MRLLVLSDLHVEFSPFQPNPEVLKTVDVVVLAGDIHAGAQVAQWSRKTFEDKPIVLVAGNHELYDGHWDRTLDDIRESARMHDVHFLENDSVVVDGVEFLGTTLWTDFAYFGVNQIRQAMNEARRYMMDYKAIKGCTPEETWDRHRKSLAWLEQELKRDVDPKSRVVVTHHYPHRRSTAAQFRSDLCTAAFGSHLPEHLFERAGLWIHGHTHSSCAYEVNQCLVVCNPRGYPLGRTRSAYENEAFDPHLQLELSKDGLWSKARSENADGGCANDGVA